MSHATRVFVSSTSSDLKSFRIAVCAELQKKPDVYVVSQEKLLPDFRELERILRTGIEGCHAVICLVGPSFGAALHNPVDGELISYTQLEWRIARELQKPVFVFMPTADCPFDDSYQANAEPPEHRMRQQAHVAEIRASGLLRKGFNNVNELVNDIRQLLLDSASLAGGVTQKLAVAADLKLDLPQTFRAASGTLNLIQDVHTPLTEAICTLAVKHHGSVIDGDNLLRAHPYLPVSSGFFSPVA